MAEMTEQTAFPPPLFEACSDTFPAKSGLQHHDAYCASNKPPETSIQSRLKKTTTNEGFKCEICGVSFSRRYILRCHYRTHDGSKPYQCGVCGERFTWAVQLRIHSGRHPNGLVFKCQHCDEKFRTGPELQKHAVTHPRTGVSSALKTPMNVVKKKSYRKSTSATNSYCAICQKYFHKFSYLRNHRRVVHSGEILYECATCGEAFRWAMQLRVHAAKHPNEPAFKCMKCNAAFMTHSELTKHKRKHPKFRYECTVCTEKFVLLKEIIAHSKRHTRAKCYKCTECDRCFAHAHLLTRHVAGHDPERCEEASAGYDEPGQRYHCGSCTSCFSRSELLAAHVRQHQDPRPHQCEWCGKCFLRADNLRCHLRIHTGEKPFTCDFCKKGFKESGQLVKHRRTHTGEKPFNCEWCGKGFTDSSKVRKHVRSMHSGPNGEKNSRKLSKKAVVEKVNANDTQSTSIQPTWQHVCEYCGKNFLNPKGLKMHQRLCSSKTVAPTPVTMLDLAQTINLGLQPVATESPPAEILDTSQISVSATSVSVTAPIVAEASSVVVAGTSELVPTTVLLPGTINDLGHTVPYECGLCYLQFMDSNEIIAHMETHTGGSTSCVFLPNGESGRAYTDSPQAEIIITTNPTTEVPQFDADVVREFFQQQEQILSSTNEAVEEVIHEEVPLELSSLLSSIPSSSNQKLGELAPLLGEDSVIQNASLMPTAELTKPGNAPSILRKAKRQRKKASTSKPGPATVGGVPIASEPGPTPLYDLFASIEASVEKEKLSCDVCHREFRSKLLLVHHMNLHTGEKPFGCKYCPEHFRSYYRLVTHSMDHEQYDKKCFICYKQFDIPEKLLKHTRYHLSQTKTKCSVCDQTFTNSISLDEHMRSAHSSSEPHQCEHCGKLFKLKANLDNHVRTHTGEKPFGPCEYCGKFFRESGQFKRHTRTHTGDRPHKCPFCPKAFIDSAKRKRHVKTVHKEMLD